MQGGFHSLRGKGTIIIPCIFIFSREFKWELWNYIERASIHAGNRKKVFHQEGLSKLPFVWHNGVNFPLPFPFPPRSLITTAVVTGLEREKKKVVELASSLVPSCSIWCCCASGTAELAEEDTEKKDRYLFPLPVQLEGRVKRTRWFRKQGTPLYSCDMAKNCYLSFCIQLSGESVRLLFILYHHATSIGQHHAHRILSMIRERRKGRSDGCGLDSQRDSFMFI